VIPTLIGSYCERVEYSRVKLILMKIGYFKHKKKNSNFESTRRQEIWKKQKVI